MKTSELKEFAELAQAAYAHFNETTYDDKDDTIDVLRDFNSTLNTATFSEKQADLFTQNQ